MISDETGVIATFKREPEQTKRLLKIVFGAAVGIVVWGIAAGMLLPAVVTALVSLVLIVMYAACITYIVTGIVQATHAWQQHSSEQAGRLSAARRRSEAASQAIGYVEEVEERPAPPPPASHSVFHRAGFMLRLNDEVMDARRRGDIMCVVAMDVTVPDRALSVSTIEKVNAELARLVAGQQQTISLALSVGPTEIVFSLPGADSKGARSFVSKMVQAMGNYWCHYGIASYPDEATTAESLFLHAREACEASRQGQSLSSAA